MNYYDARELHTADGLPSGKWHYTCQNNRDVWAVGYCSPLQSCPDCPEDALPISINPQAPPCDTCQGKRLVRVDNPCPGHDSKEGAYEHYRQYLLDKARFRGPKKNEWPKEKCSSEGCNEVATHIAEAGYLSFWEFCEKHCNREELAKKLSVGISWES